MEISKLTEIFLPLCTFLTHSRSMQYLAKVNLCSVPYDIMVSSVR